MRLGIFGTSSASPARFHIEALEARIAPATIFVTSLADSGDGTLRAAIEQANADDGPDVIKFKAKGEIILESALPAITDALTIKGKGSAKTIIDGAGAFRVLEIASASAIKVTISGVTLENGLALEYGGGLAIDNSGGKVSITKSVIRDNVAFGDGAQFTYGGGIANENALLILTKSTVTGNQVFGGDGRDGTNGTNGSGATPPLRGSEGWGGGDAAGGGIFNGAYATLTIQNSTISGNTALGGNGGIGGNGGAAAGPALMPGAGANGGYGGDAYGGGIGNRGTISIQKSSITGNTVIGGNGGRGGDSGGGSGFGSDGGNGGYGGFASGGGIFSAGLLIVGKSTVSGNEGVGGLGALSGAGISGYDGYDGWAQGGGIAIDGFAALLEKTTISGNATEHGGGVWVGAGEVLIKNSLITTNEALNGGGIYLEGGATRLLNSTVGENAAETTGGGIHAEGDLEVVKSRITGNTAGTSPAAYTYYSAGGGIYVEDANVRITDSVISFNSTGGDGGGVYLEGGEVVVNKSVISFNTARYYGGGISNDDGYLHLVDSVVMANEAGQDGGGIELNDEGVTIIERSLISSNTAGQDGGGISISDYVELVVRESTISGNLAMRNGGGLSNTGEDYYDAYASVHSASMTRIERSTFVDNFATEGGGIFHTGGELDVVSSTIAFNEAVRGGGVSVHAAIEIVASTIARNAADAAGGGVWVEGTLGMVDVRLESSIIADNVAPSGPDVLGRMAASFSLIENDDGALLHNYFSITNTDPLLGPLKKNGGFTQTMAPKPKSPVVDAGIGMGELYDQTGRLRIRGAGIDIGAVEVR